MAESGSTMWSALNSAMPFRPPSVYTSPMIEDRTNKDWIGGVCLLLGVVGIAYALVGGGGGMPWEIARIWQQTPALFLLGSIALLLIGGWLTWRRNHPLADWSPRATGPRFQSLLLYTRQNCGLCEEAAAVLAEYRAYLPPIVEVDVDSDPALTQRFDTCVPVVEIDGKIRFRGRINALLLRRLIESTPPLDGTTAYDVGPRTQSHN